MTCHDARELLSALVDDALAGAERDGLDAHLATCGDCRRELQRLSHTVALLQSVEPVRAPAGFVDRVLGAARSVPWPLRLFRALVLPWPLKLPVGAAAIVLVAVGVLSLYRAIPELEQTTHIASAPPRENAERVRPASREPSPPEPARQKEPVKAREESRAPAEKKTPESPRRLADDGRSGSDPTTPRPDARRQQNEGLMAAQEQSRVGDKVDKSEDAQPSASGLQRAAGRPAAEPPVAAMLAPDVTGQLIVSDQDAALRGLRDLIARLGASEQRRLERPEGAVVDVTIPRESYSEFVRGLERLGRWQPVQEPAGLPAQVRVILRITG